MKAASLIFNVPRLLMILLTGFISPTSSQSFDPPSKLKQFNITVNFEDYTVKTQMLSQEKKIPVNNDRLYMWYSTQKIMETKGGYDGKLIHGVYKAFYLNNQLKEQGCVKYGLKNKEWKYWYPDGKLKEVITWKNGVKNGFYALYNDYGQMMAKGNFKQDKLHGKFYTYGNAGSVLEKKVYKNGNEEKGKN
jgi:antitoxin component YwqK of YwqJK toxin-antitoxin module